MIDDSPYGRPRLRAEHAKYMRADATIRNLRRHDHHYDNPITGEPNRIAWCAYYREQLINLGVIVPTGIVSDSGTEQ